MSRNAPPARSRNNRGALSSGQSLLAHLPLILLCLVLVFPLYWMVVTGLKSLTEALQVPPTLWPQSPSFDSFGDAMEQAPFIQYALNSLLVATITALGHVVLGAMAGYGFARGSFNGRGWLFAIVLATAMVPNEAIFVPNLVVIREAGWYNSYLALTIPWLVSGMSVFLFRQAFLGVPGALLEAARIDGASEWRVYRSIALPMVTATSVTVFILNFLWSWNAYLWPLLVTSDTSVRTIQLGLAAFRTEGGVYINLLMAATALSVIPVVIVFIITQRFVIRGIGQGAVK